MISYNRLVRDNIPAIIEESGKQCRVKILDDKAYAKALNKNFFEEVDRIKQAKKDEEIIKHFANLYEIMRAIALNKGVSEEQLLHIVKAKHDRLGGFGARRFI